MNRTKREIIREIRRLHARREPLNITAVKRNHPELIERVYKTRPFWGWKRALEDAGLDYKKINVELRDYVDCKICGEDRGQLNVHLLRKHNVTADDYRQEYPGAETICETQRAAIAEHRLRRRLPLRRWELVWTPEYALDRIAEMRRRNLPLNSNWVTEHDQALSVKGREYFGSWDEALRRVELDPDEVRLAKPTEHLTKEELIKRLKKIGTKGGDFRAGSKDDSALANAAQKYFGSWNAALRAAGFEPRYGRTRWHAATKAQIVTELRRRKRTGERLRSMHVAREKHGKALQHRVSALFRTWNNALRAAGIEPPKENSPWRGANKAAILSEIRRRAHAGESLATRKIERTKWGCPLINRAKILFGSWAAAFTAAGIKRPAGLMSPWPKANAKMIIAEIRRRKRARASLRVADIEGEEWGTPLLNRVRVLFGSWNAALIAAGLEPNTAPPSRWARAGIDDILAEIRRRKHARESLRYSYVEREPSGKPLLRHAAKLFGSWRAAVAAANGNSSR